MYRIDMDGLELQLKSLQEAEAELLLSHKTLNQRHDVLAAWADALGELRATLASVFRANLQANQTQPHLLQLAETERLLLQQGLQLTRSSNSRPNSFTFNNNNSWRPAAAGADSSAPQAPDPLAFFRAHASQPPRPDAGQMTVDDLVRELKQATMQMAVHLQQLHLCSASPRLQAAAAQEEALHRLQQLWSSWGHVFMSLALLGRYEVLEELAVVNFDTLEWDVDGSLLQDMRTADLPAQLQLSQEQVGLISRGMQAYRQQMQPVMAERQQLQAQWASSAVGGCTAFAAAAFDFDAGVPAGEDQHMEGCWPGLDEAAAAAYDEHMAGSCSAGGAAGCAAAAAAAAQHQPVADSNAEAAAAELDVPAKDSPDSPHLSAAAAAADEVSQQPQQPMSPTASTGSSGSSASSSSSRGDPWWRWERQHVQAEDHTSRLQMLLQKESLLKVVASFWVMGCLTVPQLSKAAVLSYPFYWRPLWLAEKIAGHHEQWQQGAAGSRTQQQTAVQPAGGHEPTAQPMGWQGLMPQWPGSFGDQEPCSAALMAAATVQLENNNYNNNKQLQQRPAALGGA